MYKVQQQLDGKWIDIGTCQNPDEWERLMSHFKPAEDKPFNLYRIILGDKTLCQLSLRDGNGTTIFS